MKKKLLLTLSSCFLLACSPVFSSEKLSPKCDSDACFIVAKKVDWPQEQYIKGVITKVGPFSINLPSEIKKISTLQPVPVSIVKYKESSISFELIQKKDIINYLGEDIKESNIKIIDHPAILFKDTPSSPEPKINADKKIWRWIFNNKKLVLSNGVPTFYCTKDDLVAYFTGNSSPDWDSHAVITSTLFPDSYLKIQAEGLGIKDIEKIIASIE